MYFIDRNEIEKTLVYIEGLVTQMENNSFHSYIEQLSLERIVHMTIEAMLDVGNMMIDGFIMRDPGSFTDIIDILVDEKVLPQTESDNYKAIINLRKMLVKDYLNIDHSFILQVINENKDALTMFGQKVRDYLDKETGVATTFTK